MWTKFFAPEFYYYSMLREGGAIDLSEAMFLPLRLPYRVLLRIYPHFHSNVNLC